MSSFINLLANDIWTDADITRRTEAMIRTEFSAEAETILNRKVLGMALGTYQPTPEDQADIARYNAVALAAHQANAAAREDMALLLRVFPVEAAMRRLELPPPSEEATPEEVEADTTERAEAQAVVDAAAPEVLDLVELRRASA